MEILVSIIVPVYNVEKYVSQCVEAIISQASPDIELIAVDDGSADNSGRICDKYALEHPDIMRVIHKENGGLSDARNVGMMTARGKYVFFVDSDDYIEPDALDIIRDVISEFDFPDMILFDFNKVQETGEIFETLHEDVPHSVVLNFDNERRLMFTVSSACNRVVKRIVYTDNDILFPKGIWYEDLCVTPRLCALSGQVVYIPRTVFNYRMRKGSIMSSRQLERKTEIITAFSELIQWFQDHGLYEDYKTELEFLAVYHILFYTSVDILKTMSYHPTLGLLREYVINTFPHFLENAYLPRFSPVRKQILHQIFHRRYRLLHLLFRTKSLFLGERYRA